LRAFAGRLDLDPSGTYRPLGDGYAYAAFTKDRVSTYALEFDGGERFYVYELGPDGLITGRYRHPAYSENTSAPCSMPIFYPWPGHNGKSLVRMLRGGLANEYVATDQGAVHLVEFP
jgi:hypothetical protein